MGRRPALTKEDIVDLTMTGEDAWCEGMDLGYGKSKPFKIFDWERLEFRDHTHLSS